MPAFLLKLSKHLQHLRMTGRRSLIHILLSAETVTTGPRGWLLHLIELNGDGYFQFRRLNSSSNFRIVNFDIVSFVISHFFYLFIFYKFSVCLRFSPFPVRL